MNSEINKRFEHRVLWLPAALIMLILSPHTSAQNVGYVKDMNGKWLLNSQPLRRGQALPPKGRITFQDSDTLHNFINIADQNGKTIIYKNCDNQDECSHPITLSDGNVSGPSLAGTIFRIIMDQIFRKGGDYVTFISRGGALQEAVVKLEDDKVDLGPAFINMSGGKYLLRFVPKSHKPEAKQTASLNMIPFDWDPKKQTKLAVTGLTPGIYELQLLSLQDRELLEPGTEAWILITNAGEYEKARHSFSQAVASVSEWEKDTRAATLRSFLRAYLDYLAKPDKK